MLKIVLFVVVVVSAVAVLPGAEGHGKLNEPPARNTAWRTLPNFPINYDDTALYCGGLQVMIANGGCGLCGDNLATPRPRANENTGVFGTGQIVREYRAGQVIPVSVILTANHRGYFEFSLCCNGDGSRPEPGESCFQRLRLADGSDRYIVSSTDFTVNLEVQLPAGLSCNFAVLRWHYKAGNSWGVCEDGTGAMGCGEQETFRNCADVRIV